MRKSAKIMLVILAVLLAAAIAGGLLIRSWLGKTNYQKDEDVMVDQTVFETETEAAEEMHAADIYDISAVHPVTDREAANTYTLLVIGGASPEDEESAEKRGNAYAVIVMTINHNTKESLFYSFDTDLYVEIPGAGGGRLGNAYAVGGGPLLIQTMEANYGLHIDNYASISFKDVARILQMPEFETIDVSKDGLVVVKELVYSLGAKKAVQVTSYISELMPYVTHNLDPESLLRIVLQIPRIIPYYGIDGMIPGQIPVRELDGYLVPDALELAQYLKLTLYGRPSGESLSEQISESCTEGAA